MYYNPEINNEGVLIKTFSELGVLTPFQITEDIKGVYLGYIDGGLFNPLLRVKEEFTPLDVLSLDTENLVISIYYDNIHNKRDDYKVVNKITKKSLQYKFRYENVNNPVLLANTTLGRYNYFMPKWSTAYKNDISTYNKFFYPIFENLEKTLMINHETVRNNIKSKEVVNWQKETSNKKIIKVSEGNEEVKLVSNRLKAATDYIELIPLSSNYTTFSTSKEDLVLPLKTSKELSRLYIQNTDVESIQVYIEGYDSSFNFVQEHLDIFPSDCKMTSYDYSIVTTIESNNEFRVLNHVDGKDINLIKSDVKFYYFTDQYKDYSSVIFKLEEREENILLLSEFTDTSLDDPIKVYNIQLLESLKAPRVFVSSTGTVLVLNSNTLYSGVLRDPIEKLTNLHPSNNRTDFITIDNDTKIANDTFTFNIDVDSIIRTSGELSCFLSLAVNDTIYYVDNDIKFSKEKVRYHINSTSKNILIDLAFKPNYIYSLTLNSDSLTLSASTYCPSVELNLVHKDIEHLCFNNESLYLKQEGKSFKALEGKNVYEFDSSANKVSVTKDKNLEVIYEDFTKELI